MTLKERFSQWRKPMSTQHNYDVNYLRSRIESTLASGGESVLNDKAAIQELAQEFSIYYQELEYQNAELKRISMELEQAQKKYSELYENAPMAFVSYSEDMVIHAANRTFTACIGVDRPQGKRLDGFIEADTQDVFYLHVRKLLKTGSADAAILQFRTPDGTVVARMESNLMESDGATLIRSAIVNITAEHKLSKKLNETLNELQIFKDRMSGVMLANNVAWWQMEMPSGNVQFSENKARMLGYPPERFRHYTDFTQLLHPDDLEPAMQAMRRCLEQGQKYSVDYRIQTQSGEYIWCNDIGVITSRDPAGNPTAISGMVFNITDRVQLTHQAEQTAEKLRKLFDFVPMGITIADKEGKIIDSNRTAGTILGIAPEKQKNRKIRGHEWKIIRRDGSEMPPEEFASVRALAEDRQIEGVEMGIVKENGETTWLMVNATTTAIPGFDLIVSYLDTGELVRKEEQLMTSGATLRMYLENIPQPVVITDHDGVIQEINPAFTAFYGYEREAVIGKDPRILNPGRQTYYELGYDEPQYEKLFEDLWKTAKNPRAGTWEGIVINRKKDESLIWVKLVVKGIFDSTGKLIHMIALPMDISPQIILERQNKIELYRTIAGLSELRDNETGNHMRRVGIFARHLAKRIGQPEKFCQDIELFAPMHDIGKVGITDALLLAPRRLSPDEFEIMKQHTQLGHNIVSGNIEMRMAADITLHHHEWWDGSGYPHGLAGTAIPLSARITALADVYDALRSERPYKKGWEHIDVVREIQAGSGTHFDPELVELFLDMEKIFETVYRELRD